MKPPEPIEISLPHRHPERSEWRPGSPDADLPDCPGCGGPLAMAPAAPGEVEWAVATCKAPRCGEVVTFRACERRFIVAERRRR